MCAREFAVESFSFTAPHPMLLRRSVLSLHGFALFALVRRNVVTSSRVYDSIVAADIRMRELATPKNDDREKKCAKDRGKKQTNCICTRIAISDNVFFHGEA